MKRHVKLFEAFNNKQAFFAGIAFKREGEDHSFCEGPFHNSDDAIQWLIQEIEDVYFGEYNYGAAYVVLSHDGECPEPNFRTARGEVLIEGDFEPIIILDVADEESRGGYYMEDNMIISKAQAIKALRDFTDSASFI